MRLVSKKLKRLCQKGQVYSFEEKITEMMWVDIGKEIFNHPQDYNSNIRSLSWPWQIKL